MSQMLDNLPNEVEGENQTKSESQNTNSGTEESQHNESLDQELQQNNLEQVEEVAAVENEQVENHDKPEYEERIPLKNYNKLTAEVLIGEAKNLLSNYPVHLIRKHFFEIRKSIGDYFKKDEELKKQQFESDGGNPIDFYYENANKQKFYQVYNDFKKQLDTYNKELAKKEQENLDNRLAIIEELKKLYLEPSSNNAELFSKFRELKTKWNSAGRIPRSQSRDVFRNYYHHLDNFYQYLNLNKELQTMDYEHNLEVRQSIIARTEQLVTEPNVQKALNELQYLHKMWKEEAVPVAEEFRDKTWNQFKEITQKIHDRKEEFHAKIREQQLGNLKKKQAVIAEIVQLTQDNDNLSHSSWQKKIRTFEGLRNKFIATGRVPRENNKEVWDSFKEKSRIFNRQKNQFYKQLKSEQQENLKKKLALLEIAKQHQDSNDWNQSVKEIKRIQNEWKKVGHVPRNQSDKIWNEFKDACNAFFDRYKGQNQKTENRFFQNYKDKEQILDKIKNLDVQTNKEEALKTINDLSIAWSSVGKIPRNKMGINQIYQDLLSKKLADLSLSQAEIQDFKINAIIQQIAQTKDNDLLEKQIYKLRKEIDDLQKEYKQLETNINFFSNANQDNPLVKEVYEQIRVKKQAITEKEIVLRKLSSLSFKEEPSKTEETNLPETE